jgi:8-oxo-dGTP diphosphatase
MTSPHDPLHVAVAVIANDDGDVLLSRRGPHVHQANRWEFPGGKAEAGEGRFAALVREIAEELGIHIRQARPLIRVRHRYPEREVLLDVWRVERFEGEPYGREGQEVRWVARPELRRIHFPDANRPIVAAVTLPPVCLVTPEPGDDPDAFIAQLSRLCRDGIELVQFRAKRLVGERFDELARAAVEACHAHGARIVINGAPEQALALGADGVHLDARRLMQSARRPLSADRLVCAACHDREAIAQAARLEADFVLVSPVLETASHPGATPLGWSGLQDLAERAAMPVYALGGMDPGHLPLAWEHGAQGIAAIRSLWEVRSRSSSA